MLKSIRAKLQLMLLLLIIIVSLMLVNYLMNQAVVKWDHTYAEVMGISNQFANSITEESAALQDSKKFLNVKNSYKALHASCLNCHDSNPGDILLTRNELLDKLHDNQLAGIASRQTINKILNDLIKSVRYIHEHHIATLKNFLMRNQLRENAYQSNEFQGKSSTQSAPELDIIQQTVAIQNCLAYLYRVFYILKDSQTPLALQTNFSNSLSSFYNAVNTFESYSLDAQDGLLVEELIDSGRTFEKSFTELIWLKDNERKIFLQLDNNRKDITDTISLVQVIVQTNRDKINSSLTLLEYSSFFFITLLMLLIIRQGKIIINSINHLAKETEKIKKDYTYRIPENPDSENEFNGLSQALNSMAENLDERIKKLNKEIQLRTQAEKEKAATEIYLQRAEQKAAIGTLAAGIAHDFNNLLTAILGNITLAIYSLPPEDKTYEALIAAEKASKRAHKLTTQLLTFSKGGAPVKETAPISEVIRESADFILHGSNVVCSINIPNNLWLVKIDKGQIGQVIKNLTINADQAMPTGGTITIACRNYIEEKDTSVLGKGRYVQVSVQDQGRGIDAENLSRVFDPYFTTKETGSVKGSGLGLAIVYSIIARHDGYISVQSESQIGSTFTFYLPAENEMQMPKQQTSGEILMGKGKILIMDDEVMIQTMMQQSLNSLGYEIETADNGKQALEKYDAAAKKKIPFDLVIMDLTIPGGMGGKETAIKILSLYPDATLLVSSGYADDPVMVNPSRYGFKAALKKPYALKDLSQMLHKFIKH